MSFLRVEQIPYFEILNQAQIIALIIIVVAIPLVVFKAQFVKPTQHEGSGAGYRRTR